MLEGSSLVTVGSGIEQIYKQSTSQSVDPLCINQSISQLVSELANQSNNRYAFMYYICVHECLKIDSTLNFTFFSVTLEDVPNKNE